MPESLPELYLARHGETAWTISRQHTGRSDIPLTERGERNARSLGERLRGTTFTTVLTSSLIRARRTAELAGFGDLAVAEHDLMEWDYGQLRRQDDGRDPPARIRTGRSSATAVPAASRSPRWVPGPIACIGPPTRPARAAFCSSATATSSGSWPHAGWAWLPPTAGSFI